MLDDICSFSVDDTSRSWSLDGTSDWNLILQTQRSMLLPNHGCSTTPRLTYERPATSIPQPETSSPRISDDMARHLWRGAFSFRWTAHISEREAQWYMVNGMRHTRTVFTLWDWKRKKTMRQQALLARQ